jgi:hypothetical protein
MTTVEDIEKAIAKLKPTEIDRLRAWFEEFQAERFDEKIERDARAGKLDRAADQAQAEHGKGRSRELRSISPARHSGTRMKSFPPRFVNSLTKITHSSKSIRSIHRCISRKSDGTGRFVSGHDIGRLRPKLMTICCKGAVFPIFTPRTQREG